MRTENFRRRQFRRHNRQRPFIARDRGYMLDGHVAKAKADASVLKQQLEDGKLEYRASTMQEFELFCSACDNFNTEKCPRKMTDPLTEWHHIGCTNFCD